MKSHNSQFIIHYSKYVLVALIIVLSISWITQTSADISTGLVGHWTFDEGSGTTAGDSSGNGNTGTLTNGPTWTAGQIGQALSFDGVDDYVETGSSSVIPTDDFTYSVWVNLRSNTDETIVMAAASGTNEFELFINSSSLLCLIIDGSSCGATQTTATIPTNQWKHLVVTRSGSDVVFYIDGSQDSTDTLSGTMSFGACTLLFGVDVDSGCNLGLGNYLDGLIDEVRIYNRVLSAAEVKLLYDLGK